MRFETARHCEIGGRAENEDAALRVCEETRCLIAVADGLGGHGGGAIASAAALAYLESHIPSANEDALKALAAELQHTVLAQQTERVHMKTTLGLVLADGERLAFLHIGDSRVYHFRGGEIAYQSRDHSVSQLAVLAGEITPGQIRFHEDRSHILRALGGESATPEIVMCEEGARKGDAFLVCTDGFWEYVLESEMAGTLRHAADAKDWLRRMLKCLNKRAPRGRDNCTAVAAIARG